MHRRVSYKVVYAFIVLGAIAPLAAVLIAWTG